MERERKGFTLAELLIVVAIIAVLVAVSIPIFGAQLKKARLAADQANVRSAKAAAAAEYMSDGETGEVQYLYDGNHVVKIDDSSSASTFAAIEGYGKSDGKDNKNQETGASGTPKNAYILITMDDSASQQIMAQWVSNFEMKGNVSTTDLKDQIEKAGMDPKDVITFTAAEGTKLDSVVKGDNTLAYLFRGFDNLKTIDLSNAELIKGNMELFGDIPDSVQEIVLPQCNSNYDIRGKWYYADGSRVIPVRTGSGADSETDTRIEKGHSGQTIYRNPPAGTSSN